MVKKSEHPPKKENETERRKRVLQERAEKAQALKKEIDAKTKRKSEEELAAHYEIQDIPPNFLPHLATLVEAYPEAIPRAVFNQFVRRTQQLQSELDSNTIKPLGADNDMRGFFKKLDIQAGDFPKIGDKPLVTDAVIEEVIPVKAKKLEKEAQDVVTQNIEARHSEDHPPTLSAEPSPSTLDTEVAPEEVPASENPEEQEELMNKVKAAYAEVGVTSEDTMEESSPQDIERKEKQVPLAADEYPAVYHFRRPEATARHIEKELPGSEEVPQDIDDALDADRTPKEWKSKLSSLLEKAGKGLSVAERARRAKEYLGSRVRDLETDAQKAGITERGFRWVGEKYNKLGWKSKLAIGAGLGLGAGIGAAAASLPAIIAFGGAIALQRTAGLSSMYLKLENSIDSDERWRKEKAMLKSILYTAGMTAGTVIAVQEISKTEWAKDTGDWIKERSQDVWNWLSHLDSRPNDASYNPHTEEPISPPKVSKGTVAPIGTSEAPAPSATAEQSGVAPIEHTPGIPDTTIHAAPGKGYEYVLKRMWEEVQQKHLDPTTFSTLAEDSHLRQLIAATPDTVDRVVHAIASSTGYLQPDGTSALVQREDVFAFRTDGNIGLVVPGEDPVMSPPEGRLPSMPLSTHEAVPSTQPQKIEVEQPVAKAPIPQEYIDAHQNIPLPQEPEVAAVTPKPETDDQYGNWDSEPPQPISDAFTPPPLESVEKEPASLTTGEDAVPQKVEAPQTDVPAPQEADVPTSPAEQASTLTKNQYGLTIATNEAHIYSDGEGRFSAYGGSPEQRAEAIKDFLTRHPDKLVQATDDAGKVRIPWFMRDGKLEAGPPLQTSGFFGFFSSWMAPPHPDEFEQFIK